MKIDSFEPAGLKLVTLNKFGDDRGFFCERFNYDSFEKAGLPTKFIQDNFSRSSKNVVRGLHFQFDQPQGKLVTVMHGKILDVAVDIRVDSPTFGSKVEVILSCNNPQWFWIPSGFAHGFQVLSDSADVMYKVDNYYNPKGEGAIHWQDQEVGVGWVDSPSALVSGKDAVAPSFLEYKAAPKF